MNKVLIVDDLEPNRKLLKKMLAFSGNYEFVEANNGLSAISIYEQEQPDLILMDIDMPEMDGYQSASIIKSKMGENYTPIIFITAMSFDGILKKALASGGDDFIAKPFDAEVLLSKVNAHLRIRKLNQQLNDKNIRLNEHNQYLSKEQELIEHFFDKALERSFLAPDIIKYHMSPMSVFAGDVLLVAKAPEGGLYLVMGDFTGHGLTAAMGTLPVAMIFFKMVNRGESIKAIAREINFQLQLLMPSGMFFAATLLKMNPVADNLEIWMGGLPESYWLSKKGELKGLIHSKHMALGILSDDKFNDNTEDYSISEGDKIYLYSDGITETHNPEGEIYGDERFKASLLAHQESRFNKILSDLKLFAGTTEQKDDITLVELTCRKMARPVIGTTVN